MGAILSGIVLHGPTRAYGGTFLQFSDYMRGAVRLAALMDIDTIYVWTHDSIGLGEDGPTHQPIEHLAALRAIPRLSVVRPADANETAYAWRTVLARGATSGPVGLILTRQGVPVAGGHQRRGRRPRRLHPGRRSERRRTRRRADRHRLRGPARRRGAEVVGGQGHYRAGGFDAVRGMVRVAARATTATACCRRRCRPGSPSRPGSRSAGTSWSATPGRSCRSSTTGNPPTPRLCSVNSASPRKPSLTPRNEP